MKNNILPLSLIAIIGCVSFIISGCKKEQDENKQTIIKLYNQYHNGEISECKYKGQTVYSAAMNVYDGSTIIYDSEAKKIGSCNFAYNQVDPLCGQINECEVVYRVKDNIWGQPAVDKYGLTQ